MSSTVAIRLASGAATPDRTVNHPKLTFVDDLGASVYVPFAPQGGDLPTLSPEWVQVDRAGRRQPLTVYRGGRNRTLPFDLYIEHVAGPQAGQSIEPELYALMLLAGRANRISVRGYGILVGGPWRITNLDVSATKRQYGTNAITAATATMELTSAVDAVNHVSPISGGAKSTATAARAGSATVAVGAGESAARAAYRALGATSAAGALLDANGIRDPRRLTAGRTLTVPA